MSAPTKAPDHSLLGKVAIVTGGAGGLGEPIARHLAAAGAAVVISDIAVNKGRAVADAIGDQARFFFHDVTQRGQWDDLVTFAEAEFGPVGILINSAGIHDGGPIVDFSEERYRRVIDVNQIGTFLGLQAILATMRRAGGGSIVNISSTAGLNGWPNSVAYIASKFAIRGMTKVAAHEFGPYGIRVNSVHPGPISTPMTAGRYDGNPAQPIPRLGRPDEVAQMMLFLASDASSFCTGSEFTIDGGQMITVAAPVRLV
jgi:3alpha(or 20beta)-hydroxysteroid dehydrogenase